MLTEQTYAVKSLETNAFFGRIMKEHSIFMEAGFTPKNADFARKADGFKETFEDILHSAVTLSRGVIRPAVVASGELVTDYTLGSEEKTQNFTGIMINMHITKQESVLFGSENPRIAPSTVRIVRQLNNFAIKSLDGLISFKKQVLNDVLSCKMFTGNYPHMIEHITKEAELYRNQLQTLESGEDIDTDFRETALFWDDKMEDHAEFIRGLLDPTEKALMKKADDFAEVFNSLSIQTQAATEAEMRNIAIVTLEKTKDIRNFKAAGTDGINRCKIRSVIVPLLADHVLREANHFLRVLGQF